MFLETVFLVFLCLLCDSMVFVQIISFDLPCVEVRQPGPLTPPTHLSSTLRTRSAYFGRLKYLKFRCVEVWSRTTYPPTLSWFAKYLEKMSAILWWTYYGSYMTADMLRQICYGRYITADILRQIHYSRYITAEVFQQIYHGRYVTADILRNIYIH